MCLHGIGPFTDFLVIGDDGIVEGNDPFQILAVQAIAAVSGSCVLVFIEVFVEDADQAVSKLGISVGVCYQNRVRVARSDPWVVFAVFARCGRDFMRLEVRCDRLQALPSFFVVRVQLGPYDTARAGGQLLRWRCDADGKGGIDLIRDNAFERTTVTRELDFLDVIPGEAAKR